MLAKTLWPCMLAIPLWPGMCVGVCTCWPILWPLKENFVHVGQHSGSGHKGCVCVWPCCPHVVFFWGDVHGGQHPGLVSKTCSVIVLTHGQKAQIILIKDQSWWSCRSYREEVVLRSMASSSNQPSSSSQQQQQQPDVDMVGQEQSIQIIGVGKWEDLLRGGSCLSIWGGEVSLTKIPKKKKIYIYMYTYIYIYNFCRGMLRKGFLHSEVWFLLLSQYCMGCWQLRLHQQHHEQGSEAWLDWLGPHACIHARDTHWPIFSWPFKKNGAIGLSFWASQVF